MASNEYQPSNLADILRTLSALAPQSQSQGKQDAFQNTQSTISTPTPQPAFQYSAPPPVQQYIPQQWQPPMQHHQPLQIHNYEQRPPVHAQTQIQPSRPTGPDPASIIDWSTGLRCVMKSVADNERIIAEIRKLIQTQHTHETQWYAARRALIMKIEERRIGQKKLDDVLRAVGGAVSDSPAPLPDMEVELNNFDSKVYRAQHQMVREMSVKLKGLGIPFFGTRNDLVVINGADPTMAEERHGKGRDPRVTGGGYDGAGDVDGGKKRITEKELVELQRRMLGILEDLC